MTKDEALKLALEALLSWGKGFPDNWGDIDTEAVTAIKEALAQPEQEPVQWGVDWGKAGDQSCVSIIKRTPNGGIEVVAVEYGPQRTWVGLTPQERDEINEKVYGAVPHHVAFHHAIEAKLKEKNT